MTKTIIFLLSIVASSTAYSQVCTSEKAKAEIQSVTESDEGLGIVNYGQFEQGETVTIEDMIKNNHYQVQHDRALVFSAHGEYFSGYFIFVYELDARTCQILKQFLIYEE